MDDSSIIELILKGDRESFAIMIYRYEKPVFSFVHNLVRNIDASKDITQEVFITVYKKLYTYRRDCKFSNWLFRIAYNKSIDYLRKFRNNREVELDLAGEIASTALSPEGYVELKELKSSLEKFIKDLDKRDRQLLGLKLSDRKITFQDIAEILNMSESGVKSRYYRLWNKFNQQFNQRRGL